MRFVAGGLILLVIQLLRGRNLPNVAGDWWRLVVIGTLMVGAGNVAVVWAEHHISSGFAALLVSTAPLWMAFLERLRRSGDRFTTRQIAGVFVGFAGVALLIGPELAPGHFSLLFLLGAIATQFGVVGWNIGSIISKYHMAKDLDPLVSASLQMIFGGFVVGTLGILNGEHIGLHFSTRSLIAFVYLIVFGSVIAYGSYVYALSKLPTSTTSLHTYINPVVALVLGWAVLDEPLTIHAAIGMLVIFTGVGLVQFGRTDDTTERGISESAN